MSDINTATTNFEGETFSDLSNRLNEVVTELEGNTLDLEDAVAKYKEGMSIAAELHKRLANAQQQISVVDTMAPSATASDPADSDNPF